MHVTFAPKGRLQIDDARITWKNFRGEGSRYNRDGDRNFTLIIDDEEVYDALANDVNKYGATWNVKRRPPRDEDDLPFMTLSVKVKFNDYGPRIFLKSGDRVVKLDEGSVECLDNIDIESVNLDIRPYDDEINGKGFRAAYLESMEVIQNIDRFSAKYAEDDFPRE